MMTRIIVARLKVVMTKMQRILQEEKLVWRCQSRQVMKGGQKRQLAAFLSYFAAFMQKLSPRINKYTKKLPLKIVAEPAQGSPGKVKSAVRSGVSVNCKQIFRLGTAVDTSFQANCGRLASPQFATRVDVTAKLVLQFQTSETGSLHQDYKHCGEHKSM